MLASATMIPNFHAFLLVISFRFFFIRLMIVAVMAPTKTEVAAKKSGEMCCEPLFTTTGNMPQRRATKKIWRVPMVSEFLVID